MVTDELEEIELDYYLDVQGTDYDYRLYDEDLEDDDA